MPESSKSRGGKIALVALAGLLLGLSLYNFIFSVERVRQLGFFDFPIFVERTADFLETGVLYPDAGDPETWQPAAPVYKFPPLFAMLLMPWVRLASPATLCLIHWAVQIALFLVTIGLAHRLFRSGDGLLRGFLLLVLALNFQPFIETLWGLQLETPILFLLVLGLLFLTRRKQIGAGVCLALAVMLKVYPALLLAYFVVKRLWTALLAAVVVLLVVLLASWIAIGFDQTATYFSDILPVLLEELPTLSTENVSPGKYLQLWPGLEPAAAKSMTRVLSLALLVASLLLITRWRSDARHGGTEALHFALLVPAMLLSLPNSWTNYQLLLLVPLFVLAGHALSDPEQRTAVLVLALLAYLPLIFLRPCEIVDAASATWPCAQTPPLLGLVPLPRALHDFVIALRGFSPLLLWLTLAYAVYRQRQGQAATS